MDKFWEERVKDHLDVIGKFLDEAGCLDQVARLAEMAVETFQKGNKMLLCGNGGSAADAQHIAAELVGRFVKERPALNAVALSVNSSSLTAIGNDYGYDSVFSRQLEAFGREGDLLIGISTSGNSANVLKAMAQAKETGISVAALTGEDKTAPIAEEAEVCVCVPSKVTARIQEAHILIGHMVCEYIENALFNGKGNS